MLRTGVGHSLKQEKDTRKERQHRECRLQGIAGVVTRLWLTDSNGSLTKEGK